MWNRRYWDLYNKAKKIIKKDANMKSYDASRPQYLETDASDVSLGAREVHGILHGHSTITLLSRTYA